MILLVFGPQGSGKSTQAKLLAERLGFLYVSTGSILRALYNERKPQGIEAAAYWLSGNLVPDDMMNEILEAHLAKHRPYTGLVFDGYPRTKSQAVALNETLKVNDGIDIVFELRVSEKELYRRLKKRANTERRADETPQAIARRLELYKDRTNPLLHYYRDQGIPVVKINGEQQVAHIHADIVKRTAKVTKL